MQPPGITTYEMLFSVSKDFLFQIFLRYQKPIMHGTLAPFSVFQEHLADPLHHKFVNPSMHVLACVAMMTSFSSYLIFFRMRSLFALNVTKG